MESNIRQLEIDFEIFCRTGLQDLQHGVIRLFDDTRCNQQSKIQIAYIIYLTKPSESSAETLNQLFNFLNIPEELINQIKTLSSDTDPETYAENWLNSTDPSERLFTIICLLLFFSNTYKEILPDYERGVSEPYINYSREWLRRIVHTAFQYKYEEIIGKRNIKSE